MAHHLGLTKKPGDMPTSKQMDGKNTLGNPRQRTSASLSRLSIAPIHVVSESNSAMMSSMAVWMRLPQIHDGEQYHRRGWQTITELCPICSTFVLFAPRRSH